MVGKARERDEAAAGVDAADGAGGGKKQCESPDSTIPTPPPSPRVESPPRAPMESHSHRLHR